MIRNYAIIAWRNLLKNKVYSLINIGGLALGMAVALMIGLWVYDEYSFNKYHENYKWIGQVWQHNTINGSTGSSKGMPLPLGPELRSSYSGDFIMVVMSTQPKKHVIATDEVIFIESGSYMQPEAPQMFTLKMKSGSWSGLEDQNSILLSESLSKKLFKYENPMGKLVKIDNKIDVIVTGVYEDLPRNTEFNNLKFIAPWDLYYSSNKWLKNNQQDWNNGFLFVYVLLAPNLNLKNASNLIKDVKLNHVTAERAIRKPELFVHPMSRWHLESKFENRVVATSERMKIIRFYEAIGIIVLLLACINFMNISTARSEKRAKEVGIRKVVGSNRIQLIWQFLSESLLAALVAFSLAILIVLFALSWFNNIAGKEISIPWSNSMFWVAGLGFTILTGLLSGSYPSIYLSSFRPLKTLKGTSQINRTSITRQVLVVTQFTISITLIIGTLIVYQQIQFAKERPVGYSRDGLLMIPIVYGISGKHDLLANEFKNSGVVVNVAQSASAVTGIGSSNRGFDWQGKDPDFDAIFGTLAVSHQYGNTVDWQLIAGRDFSKDFSSDSSAFVINESAAQLLGFQNPIGKSVQWKEREFRIIGVVKNMVMESPFEDAIPTVFFLEGRMNWILIKIDPSVKTAKALSRIEAIFKKLITSPFDYTFADQRYASKFDSEERIAKSALIFAILAIFISCLGLFGLVSFVAEQRTKEIGIRKVLGASVANLWLMLSKDFVVLVIISCSIAITISFAFMSNWLQNYEYRVDISVWIFTAASIGGLLITLITVSFQSIKAARMNPVKSLKEE